MGRISSLMRRACVVVSLPLASCDRSERDAARWLDLEIVRPEPAQPASPVDPDPGPDADGMVTRAFRLPPTFFYSPLSSTDPVDPFADPDSTPRKIVPPQELFEKAGITFGPSTFAVGQPKYGRILVRQTPEQMELVEVYVNGMGPTPRLDVVIRIERYEMSEICPVDMIRGAAPHTDHGPEHRAVLSLLREGKARLVQSTTLHCFSGQRARNEDGYELSHSRHFLGEDAAGPHLQKIGSAGPDSSRRVGTWLEIDPVIGADGVTIDALVKLQFQTGDPVWHTIPDSDERASPAPLHPRFPIHTLEVTDRLASGEIRLIGNWITEGDSMNSARALHHLVFLQAFVHYSPPETAP